jgi:hypothetical protein
MAVSRRGFIAACCAMATANRATAATGFVVQGKATATDQELQEGYLAIGREFTLVTTPTSALLPHFRELAGREVLVTVGPPL